MCQNQEKITVIHFFFVSLHVPDNSGKQVNNLPLSRQKAKLARIESPEDNPLRPGLNLQHKIMFVFLFLHFLSIASGVVDVSLGFRGRVVRDIAWLEINIIECLDHQLMGGGTYTLHNWHFTTSYNNSCPSIVHFSFPKSDVILRHPVRHFHPKYLDAFWFYNCTSIKSYYYYQCCDSEDTRTSSSSVSHVCVCQSFCTGGVMHIGLSGRRSIISNITCERLSSLSPFNIQNCHTPDHHSQQP